MLRGYKCLCSLFHVLEATNSRLPVVIASALRQASITVGESSLRSSITHLSATDPRHRSNLFRASPTSFSDVHNPIPLASSLYARQPRPSQSTM